jgi:hypothetical protein
VILLIFVVSRQTMIYRNIHWMFLLPETQTCRTLAQMQ